MLIARTVTFDTLACLSFLLGERPCMQHHFSAVSWPFALNPGIPQSWHHVLTGAAARCRMPCQLPQAARLTRGCPVSGLTCRCCKLDAQFRFLPSLCVRSRCCEHHFAPKITRFGHELRKLRRFSCGAHPHAMGMHHTGVHQCACVLEPPQNLHILQAVLLLTS